MWHLRGREVGFAGQHLASAGFFVCPSPSQKWGSSQSTMPDLRVCLIRVSLSLETDVWENCSFRSGALQEVERLRSTRESKKDRLVELCSAPPRQELPKETTQDQGEPISSPHQAEGSSLKEKSERKEVYAQGGRQTPSLPILPSQIPLYNRYEMWKASQWKIWMMVHLHRWCCQGQKGLPSLSGPPPRGRNYRL